MDHPTGIEFSYIIPTRNRGAELCRTLGALADLCPRESEIIVIDNASDEPARVPEAVSRRVPSRLIRLEHNIGAGARNQGARAASGRWLIMLDDDSAPLDLSHEALAREAHPLVGAIGADISLADGSREAGGLPEVFVGCGVMIRRDAFLQAGGYDPTFVFYAEEYDLAACLLLSGWRIEHDTRFRVLHRKSHHGRDMDEILRRLVRNNAWVDLRYCPDHLLSGAIDATTRRYERIARKERAMRGYRAGLHELRDTANEQPRTALPEHLYDRFTGLSYARVAARRLARESRDARFGLVEEGKNAWAVRQALQEAGCRVVEPGCTADVHVVGTLSPGPALDALRSRSGPRRVALWTPGPRTPTPAPVVDQRLVAISAGSPPRTQSYSSARSAVSASKSPSMSGAPPVT